MKVPTIRYYEQIGLIDEPSRTAAISGAIPMPMPSGCALSVTPASLGLPLEAIRELISLSDAPERHAHRPTASSRAA